MTLDTILEDNQDSVVFVDTNKLSELSRLESFPENVRITDNIKLEMLLYTDIIGIDSKFLDSIEVSTPETFLYHPEHNNLVKIANSVYKLSFYESHIAKDVKNTFNLEHKSYCGLDLLKKLISLDLGFHANTLYRILEKNSWDENYIDKVIKSIEKYAILPVLNFFTKESKKKFQNKLAEFEKSYLHSDDFEQIRSDFSNSSKKNRKWWKNQHRSKIHFKSLREHFIRRYHQEANTFGEHFNLELNELYNYSDLDFFTLAYMEALTSDKDVILYTADKDFVDAAKNFPNSIFDQKKKKNSLQIMYVPQTGNNETVSINLYEDLEKLSEYYTKCLEDLLTEDFPSRRESRNEHKSKIDSFTPYSHNSLDMPNLCKGIFSTTVGTSLTYTSVNINMGLYGLYSYLHKHDPTLENTLKIIEDGSIYNQVLFYYSVPFLLGMNILTSYGGIKGLQIGYKSLKKSVKKGVKNEFDSSIKYLKSFISKYI